jgi:hypothetical protein
MFKVVVAVWLPKLSAPLELVISITLPLVSTAKVFAAVPE